MKGKVERGVGYLKTSFLKGRTFTDLDDLNRQLQHWLDTVANVRTHGTTGVRPVDRYQQEVGQLRPAAALPAYDIRPVEIRRVASDCHFSFEAVRYSVPPEACGHTVIVRSAGQPVGERLQRELQRQAQGRAVERGDLLLVGGGGRAGRAMEARVQYRPTPQRLRRLSPGP